MATTEQIQGHDRRIDRLVREFERGLVPLFRDFYDQLAEIPNPTRIQIQTLGREFRNYAQAQLNSLSDLIQDNVAMNADVLGENIDPNTAGSLGRLREETVAAVNAAIDQEINSIIAVLAVAGLVAAVNPTMRRELRSTSEAAIRRLTTAFNNGIRNYDGAFTLLRSRNAPSEVRYKYVGGVVPETRPFCEQMNGRTFTETEIRRIWNTQTWAGKRPGDPFVVRGGYNCRHFLVPVAPEEQQ
jgi:hypothetical protein